MSQERKPLDGVAICVMLLLTSSWGFQQVTIKWIAADVTPVMQAAIRSVIATVLVFAWARLRGVRLFERDGMHWLCVAAGLLFASEFLFIYAGLPYTNASRMLVFVYLTPPLTALGLHFLVPGEQLRLVQWLGVLIAFAGLVLAFADGFSSQANTSIGDLCGVIAAVFWASTTILIRATRLARATATKLVFYQLAVSSIYMPIASLLLAEKGVVTITPLAIAVLIFQGAVVGFATYLLWTWLLTRYLATPLSVLSFMTPMFGVLFGVLLLSEPLSATFAAAAVLVAVGIVLVNLRR